MRGSIHVNWYNSGVNVIRLVTIGNEVAFAIIVDHNIWYTPADSPGNGHRLKTICPSIPQGAFWGGFRGSEIKKSGITSKRVDQLAHNLVHVCGFNWEWTYAKNN